MSAARSKPLAPAPAAYNQREQQQLRADLEERDLRDLKKDRHLELDAGASVILRSPNGTRYYLTVDNAGALGTSAV